MLHAEARLACTSQNTHQITQHMCQVHQLSLTADAIWLTAPLGTLQPVTQQCLQYQSLADADKAKEDTY